MIKIMTIDHQRLRTYSILGLLCSVLLTACKENVVLPSTLVPPVDNINTFSQDTFSLITQNIYQDSILTGGLRNSSQVSSSVSLFHALGTITSDPIFGKTNANIHVEVLPPVANFTFKTGTNRTIDSIVLAIPLQGAYGDTTLSGNISQNFKVFRSLKSFPRSEAQYEFTKDSFDNVVIGQRTINFNELNDSVLVGNTKLVPQLRIPLNSDFIDSLETQIDLGANGAAADFTRFLAWWKGFYIQADSLNGNTLYYLNTYATRLNIYYRYTNVNAQPDTAVDVFSFDPNNCNRFNHITRNYSGKVTQNFLTQVNPLGDSVLFLQSEPGMAATIRMPYLHQFSNVIVNQAELSFISVSPYGTPFQDTAKYGPIPRLQIFQTDTNSTGADNVIPDYSLFGTNIVDGKVSEYKIAGLTFTRYKFAVTYAVQRLISEKNANFRFKIMGLNNGYPGAYRVMLGGNTMQAQYVQPKLKIIYTKIIK